MVSDLELALKKREEPEESDEQEEESETQEPEGAKFFVMSSYGELLDVAMHLSLVEGKKTVLYIGEKEYSKIGEGIVEKAENWHEYLGQDWIFVVDGCENAKLQDWLREQGESVVGTNEVMAELENDRQKGQDWFVKAGFNQPFSQNFTDLDSCIQFVEEHADTRWVLKQNGDAPKSINHVGKFEGNEDMLFHLNELKKIWNEQAYGKFDCDLMEFADGVEMAASAFWNGHDWLRNKEGKVVGFLNFEEKKESEGGLGETTGETGTTFYGCDETNEYFKDTLLRPEIAKMLRDSDYRGVFDINGTLTDEGFVSFEATSRFGIPATSYEFIEGLKTPCSDLLEAMARGLDTPIEIVKGWGMVMVVSAKPYPVEADIEEKSTSLGEKLWIMNGKKPRRKFSDEQLKHIHLENFYKDDNKDYKVATKNGYLLTVTGTGSSVKSARKNLIEYIKENLYVSGNKYRLDIGKRIEDFI